MNAESNRTDVWSPCTPGTLKEFRRSALSRRRWRNLTVTSSAVALVICVAALAVWTGPREYYYGGIACRDVRANIGAYAGGDLPDETIEKIRTHLRQCPNCSELMKKMRHRSELDRSGQAFGCLCPHCRTEETAGIWHPMRASTASQNRPDVQIASVQAPQN